MQLRKNENPVERIGVSGESTFTIQNNAKAFDILSSGLYTDPIMAVIRELSCNAYDAHVDANKSGIPFTVHLPSKLEPYFSVKDDGIGLSDEDIRNLYSTYFASTKTETNDSIGAFGLGSKSPFSYSKAFDVISRWEGTKRTYSVFINEDGVPTIAELAKCDTDETNGIEVKIAVRAQDYETFRVKTSQALKYFPARPIITGYKGFEFPQSSDSATITDSYIVDKKREPELIAVQGNVPYKVSRSQVEGQLNSACVNFINNHSIVLFFKIGMLDVAANREEVRYDDETRTNIVYAIEKAFGDYLKVINKKLNELTKSGSRWDVYTTLDEKFGSTWKFKTVVGDYKFDSKIANDWIEEKGSIKFVPTLKYHKIIPYRPGTVRAVKSNHHYNRTVAGDIEYVITPTSRICAVYQDVTKRGSMRMNQIFRSSSCNAVIAIVPTTDRMLEKNGVTATAKQRKTELDAIVEMLGKPTIKNVSECTHDVTVTRSAGSSGHTFKKFNGSASTSSRSCKPVFDNVPEPDDGGIYISIDLLRNIIIGENVVNLTHGTFKDHVNRMLQVINYVNKTKLSSSDIYGLTKKVVKHVKNDTNWKDLPTMYAKAIKELKDVNEFYSRIRASTALGLHRSIYKLAFKDMIERLDANSTFRNLVQPVIDSSKKAVDVSNYIGAEDFERLKYVNDRFNIDVKLSEKPYFNNNDFTNYEMLLYVNLSDGSYSNSIINYIELVESK